MRIDQILPSFGKFDAIGNDVGLMRQLIRAAGYRSEIFTDLGHREGETKHYREYPCYANVGNILIHHYSIGSDLPYFLSGIDSFKVTRYHNITPYQYFAYASAMEAFFRCREGRWQLPMVRELSDTFWTTSHYNAEELRQLDFKDGLVLPVLRRYDELAKGAACARTSAHLKATCRKTLLFVGRIMPHKGHHDLIFFLKQYHKHIDQDLRLVFVGGGEPYYAHHLLPKLCADLQLSVSQGAKHRRDFERDVIFTGTASEAALASYYRHADVFACLSEHEGFCVPVVEAMFFGLPILAHRAAAVPETIGEGALHVDKRDPLATLEALAHLIKDADCHAEYSRRSRERSAAFAWERLEGEFSAGLKQVLALHEAYVSR